MEMRSKSPVAIHISKLWAQNGNLFRLFISKNLNQAGEILVFVMIFLLSFLSLLSQQKSFHCRVVATKFYKTKIPSLVMNF